MRDLSLVAAYFGLLQRAAAYCGLLRRNAARRDLQMRDLSLRSTSVHMVSSLSSCDTHRPKKLTVI
jgi:hypothetical protein